MTTLPPTPPPAPAAPSAPLKTRSTGTTPLVFGIILCFIALFPSIRFLSLGLLAIIRADPYIFGQAIAAFIFLAVFAIPGILLIRRSNRIRKANRGAAAAAIYGQPPVYTTEV
ncbi:hypothetical protein B0I08_106266 [Glaciihabitans tibetensis]|uniref:Uncharacterized protein n=1 Tax=Glaciihabitans tibetensis TaxID=1266600 RepID=A0A2T0VC58_9MICO|nr:hypothetical protein [Glaciihabitans tibetensis]PRY67658.1 hypothetical protein B0I08_106266 [Glaciihabitans tibetensis]